MKPRKNGKHKIFLVNEPREPYLLQKIYSILLHIIVIIILFSKRDFNNSRSPTDWANMDQQFRWKTRIYVYMVQKIIFVSNVPVLDWGTDEPSSTFPIYFLFFIFFGWALKCWSGTFFMLVGVYIGLILVLLSLKHIKYSIFSSERSRLFLTK